MDNRPFGSNDRSRSNTPINQARFSSQAATAEDLLKAQTVGLVNLDDYRKRRAEALELKERGTTGADSESNSDVCPDASIPLPVVKKKRKMLGKGKLSFAADEEHDDDSSYIVPKAKSPKITGPSDSSSSSERAMVKRKLGASTGIGLKPRVLTKSALQREAQLADAARQEFIATREAVKATEIAIPFVFYDGVDTHGGVCRVKKGEHIWLFLDKARKVGAELGVGGDQSRRTWARVNLDDLMLIRKGVILPHHYDFYHFISTQAAGFDGPLFEYSAQMTEVTPKVNQHEAVEDATLYDPLARAEPTNTRTSNYEAADLEGFHDDPVDTKVVDRRWYERNKHIFPASAWAEYALDKDLSKVQKKDSEGNTFFFS